MLDLTTIFHHLQRQLFPALVAELGALSALDQQFCEVISLTDLGRFTRRYEWCGEMPSEPTFSRAFAEFAQDQLPQQIHGHLVKTHAGPKLVGHVSRDATALEAPERPVAKPAPAAPAAPRKRGRPKQGEVRPPRPPKRLELQPTRTLAENLADLPARCDVGCKRNSKGHHESQVGCEG